LLYSASDCTNQFVKIRVIRGKKISTKKIPNSNRKIGIWDFYIEN